MAIIFIAFYAQPESGVSNLPNCEPHGELDADSVFDQQGQRDLSLVQTAEASAPETPETVTVTAEVSAYTSSPEETMGDPTITASGARTNPGVIACPARLTFGTRVEIKEEIYTCEDRMHKRYRYRNVFDIWMESKQEAYQWGRRIIQVKIYSNE